MQSNEDLKNTSNDYLMLEKSMKRSMVSRILLELGHQFNDFDSPVSPVLVINQKCWRNLIGTLHYLGGAPETVDSNGFPSDPNVKSFIISPSNGQGFWDIRNYNGMAKDISIQNAKLADFIPNTIKCLKDFRRSHENPLLVTMRELKDYVTQNNPDLSLILSNIAKGNIDSPMLRIQHNGRPPKPLYNDSEAENVSDLAAYAVGRFLAGEISTLIDDLSDIGLSDTIHGENPDERIDNASKVIENLHYPSDDYKEPIL